MNKKPSSRRWISLLIVAVLFFSPSILQGCDALMDSDPHEDSNQHLSADATPVSTNYSKLRHPQLMDKARGSSESGIAGKRPEPATHLMLGINIYESNGVTRRIVDKYDVTRRILAQYGITRRLLDKYGDDIQIKVTYDQTLNALTLKINDTRLEEFLQDVEYDPDFTWVEPDFAMDADLLGRTVDNRKRQQIIPWSIDRIGATGLNNNDMDMVHVYVFDSGMYEAHGQLEIVEQKDFTMLFKNRNKKFWDESLVQHTPAYDPGIAGDPMDYSGHGTFVSGLIAAKDDYKGIVGAAPQVLLHNIKVMTNKGQTDITTLLAAVDYVTNAKNEHPEWPIVVNMSMGVDIGTTTYNILDEAIVRSIEAGVIYVVSAGNDGRDASTYSPAHVAEAITVGSYGLEDNFSDFSNYGPAVDLLAPGDLILSLTNSESGRDMNTTVLGSGTSYAAPHVVAAAAHLLSQKPNASPAQIHRMLLNKAQPAISGSPAGTTNLTVMIGDAPIVVPEPVIDEADASDTGNGNGNGNGNRRSKGNN